MAYVDILIIAVVTACLGYRLWNILGNHHNPKKPTIFNKKIIYDKNRISTNSHNKIKNSKNKSEKFIFEPKDFLIGAKKAFCIIVQSFAKGNSIVLKTLLTKEVYKNFLDAIENRKKYMHTLEIKILRIVKINIIQKIESEELIEITVCFVSEQSSITYDKNKQKIKGNLEKYNKITDIWTFERKKRAVANKWIVTSTRSINN